MSMEKINHLSNNEKEGAEKQLSEKERQQFHQELGNLLDEFMFDESDDKAEAVNKEALIEKKSSPLTNPLDIRPSYLVEENRKETKRQNEIKASDITGQKSKKAGLD